jgi:hypothetical protein
MVPAQIFDNKKISGDTEQEVSIRIAAPAMPLIAPPMLPTSNLFSPATSPIISPRVLYPQPVYSLPINPGVQTINDILSPTSSVVFTIFPTL